MDGRVCVVLGILCMMVGVIMMMLKNLLRVAKTKGFAIPVFNCTSSSKVNAVLEGDAALAHPVLVQFDAGDSQMARSPSH